MSWTQRIRQHLDHLRRGRFEQDLEQEIQSHLQLEIDRNVEVGMTPAQARQAARRSFGPTATSKEDARAVWGWASIDRLRQDFAFGVRMLQKSPGFAAVAILSLALGIGANTAIFSVVYATLLKPLPYPDSEQLVFVYETFQGRGGQGTGSTSTPNLEDWRRGNTVLDAIGGWSSSSFNLTGEGEPVVIAGHRVEPGVFSALRVAPLLGRFLSQADSEEGHDRVVVLSHGLWERRFQADPAILSKTVGLNGQRFTVIGVMPPQFQFPPRTRSEIWAPLIPPAEQRAKRGNHWMQVVARAKPGVTIEQAQANMDSIAQRLQHDYPNEQEGRGILLRPLYEDVVGNRQAAVLTLWGAVGFVLLIACANVSNLLLARAGLRRREFAVRASLGASRSRLLRQLLTETALIALLGGVAGLLLSRETVHYLTLLPGTSIPRGDEIAVDAWVLAFSIAVSLLAAFATGILPALRASRTNLHDAIKETAAGRGQSYRRDRLRTALVIAEVSLSLVVLVGAGLMLRSFQRLSKIDLGIRTESVLTMSVPLAPEKYQKPADCFRFYDDLLPRLSALPAVQFAGLINRLPLREWGTNGNLAIRGNPEPPPGQAPFAEFRTVSADYFHAMGIPLVSGRLFDAHEDPKRIIVINAAAAKAFWPDGDAVGQHLGWPDDYWFTVVGVVANVRNWSLTSEPRPEVYWPYNGDELLAGLSLPEMNLVVRTTVEPQSLAAAVQHEIWQVDPEQPVHLVKTMEQVAADAVAGPRFQTLLFGIFAGLALMLSLAGVYGVISYAVSQRTHEMGIRMALGAQPRDVLRLVLGHGLTLALTATALGIAAALALTRYLRSQLYSIEPTDATTFAAVAILLLATTLFACYIPARRAARVDPLQALRHE